MMRVGAYTITPVYELDASDVIAEVIADATPENIQNIGWLGPDYANSDGSIKAVNQSFLLRGNEQVILIDTCVGNGRPRPELPTWDGLKTDYLANLQAAGVSPKDVTMVICTHLHFDHIGWNTQQIDGTWKPTFPNATYVFVRRELEYWLSEPADELVDDKNGIVESVEPIVTAGLVKTVEPDAAINDDIRFIHTPGHTPHHVSILVESNGESALFSGDVFHHPCQIAHPEWMSFDTDEPSALQSRRNILAQFADTDTTVYGAHFSKPYGGRIVTDGNSYKLASANE